MGYIDDDGSYYEDDGTGSPGYYMDPSEFNYSSTPWGANPDGSDPSLWDENGTFIGQNNSWDPNAMEPNATQPGGLKSWLDGLFNNGGSDKGNAALNALGKGAGAVMQNQQDKRALAARAAIAESNLDPYRSYLHQAKDVGRLDMMANLPPPRAATFSTRYAQGVDLTPNVWQPSDTTRGVAGMAMRAVAAGKQAPTMTDPSNYGKLPAVNYQAPPPSASNAGAVTPTTPTDPTTGLPLSVLLRLRRGGAGGGRQPFADAI